MKRLIISGLSVLLLTAATAPIVSAQQTALNFATFNSIKTNQPQPFTLVTLAYQGYFKKQGIPSAGALWGAYYAGRVTATDLVKSAVATNILPPSVLNNQGYLSAVNTQLLNLANNR